MAESNHPLTKQTLPPEQAAAAALDATAKAIAKLRYGSVELTVHDGRVGQLEVTERQRFN